MPEDTVLQIVVTFCTAYLSFYIAQSYIEISGKQDTYSMHPPIHLSAILCHV
jgi:hypothetical protein